jgi:hypothetical protein
VSQISTSTVRAVFMEILCIVLQSLLWIHEGENVELNRVKIKSKIF